MELKSKWSISDVRKVSVLSFKKRLIKTYKNTILLSSVKSCDCRTMKKPWRLGFNVTVRVGGLRLSDCCIFADPGSILPPDLLDCNK